MIKPALVVGDINADVSIATPFYPVEGGECTAHTLRWGSGGAGVNVATGLARLGAPAWLLGRVGSDPAAAAALRAAVAAGVTLTLVQRADEQPTGVVFAAVSPAGERTFFSFRGANAGLATAPDAGFVERCGMVHLSAYALLEDPQRQSALETAGLARASAVPLSLDLAPPPIRTCAPLLFDLLPGLALLFLNQQELRALLPTLDEADALDHLLSMGIGTVALKRGPSGCSVLSRQQRIDLPALPVGACDSTGCGDAFAAGFVWGLLHAGDLATCAALGNLMGALTVTAYGSADALPTHSAMLAAAQNAPGELYATAAALLGRQATSDKRQEIHCNL